MSNLHWGWVSVVSKYDTCLKKKPLVQEDLSGNDRADVLADRSILRCKVVDRQDNHTQLELPNGLGKWWVFDDHWYGLNTDLRPTPYTSKDDLKYLKNFPYYYQESDGKAWSNSQAACLAMCVSYLNNGSIKGFSDYLNVINKYENPTHHPIHRKTMEHFGVAATFTKSADVQDIKEQIDKGKPAVICFFSKGHYTRAKGLRHYVVVTGYTESSWLVQDPCGEMDIENGKWIQLNSDAGRNIRYNLGILNRRFENEGGASGEGWFNFRLV